MAQSFKRHACLLESGRLSRGEKEHLALLLSGRAPADRLQNSIARLASMLGSHHGREIVLLVDDHDRPLELAQRHGFLEEALSFFEPMYGRAAKDNGNVLFTVFTGLARMPLAGITGGLNNIVSHDLVTGACKDFHGFGEGEIDALLEKFGCPGEKDEIRRRFGGYGL